METVTLAWLKSLDVFAEVPEVQLQWLINHSENKLYQQGEFILEPGMPITGPHLVVKGELSFYMEQHGSKREYSTFISGDVTGYLPYSRANVSSGFARALSELQLLSFPTSFVPEMIKSHFELTQALVHVMSNRVRNFAVMQQHADKMMALGKLSAGLAHELNNPASAILRDTSLLKARLESGRQVSHAATLASLDPGIADQVMALLSRVTSGTDRSYLSLKQRMSLEAEIEDWLDAHGVQNAQMQAETLADYNLGTEQLTELVKNLPREQLSPVFSLLSSLLETDRMVEDILQSSRRIVDLVSSIKNFTHMDRAQDKQFTDIRIGIANTITMLGHKIRQGNVEIVEEFVDPMPPVRVYVGEMNQVWTNLIDNALDAMSQNQKGVLTIKIITEDDFIKVSVIDNGEGISPELLSKVFDPFYTTKPMGKGTGLGLEVVQRIVRQHNGVVKVNSVPGRTEFIVCFPFDN
ncbi:ATP-binding protein [Pedobacter sp. GR22-6]|uniref:ATP-binding protein n=1 Tax=Pedobacter sp. GR22-6 TaxID=3127957 RepID=UPI00307D81E4